MSGRRVVSARRLSAAIVLAACAVLLAVAGASRATPGGAPPRGSVTREPGYYPPNDPESSSVRIGRRIHAPLVQKRFRGGARSLDELGRQVCRALHQDVTDSLLTLGVREDEFREILWPEFPQSRPATGVTWQDGWMFLYARLHGGSAAAMRDHGGHAYQFIRFDRYDSTMHYRNFNMHNGLVLVARDDAGNVQQFHWLRAVVERKGRFKIYSMKD